MGLLSFAALGVLGFVGYRMIGRHGTGPAAFGAGQHAQGNDTQVRDAGPDAMRDAPASRWGKVDEQSDESFPASDPPANY